MTAILDIAEAHIALAVPAAEIFAWRESLENHGVAIEHEQSCSLGSYAIYSHDPDNNSLELITADHYPRNWSCMLLRS